MKKRFTTSIFIIFLIWNGLNGQNLITNPGGESGASTGWTIVNEGTDCFGKSDWKITGNQNGFPAAQSGSDYFYCGCANFSASGSLEGEVYQDVDVSSYATEIDAGMAPFAFSGYLQTWEGGGPLDQGRITVEYRNTGGTVLSTYDTGIQASANTWTEYTDTRNAPSGTRTIRIILRSYLSEQTSVDAYFDNLSLTTTVVLPVELVFFSGEIFHSKMVQLKWQTASELNNEKFEIEASQNGREFQKIGEIQGHGSTPEQHDYSFKIENPRNGISYYRLKQINFDGQFEYSEVISVNFKGEIGEIGTFYPNPSKSGMVNLDYNSQNDEEIIVSVFDVSGKLIINQIQQVSNGNNNLRFDFSDLNKGIYIVKIGDQRNPVHRKLIIEK